jgi:hypothetical protein
MNRKQWFVIGGGLLLLLLYMVQVPLGDCDQLSKANVELIESGSDYTLDAHLISCLDGNMGAVRFNLILLVAVVLSIICGFLEPKKRRRENKLR